MSEPLKPRIDFDGPLQAEKIPPLKGARAFDTTEADNFAPARLVTGEEEEGAAEAVVESVLRPKRSLWRRMVSAGLAIFGVSVVAQGVQWTANAWQTRGLDCAGRLRRRGADRRGRRRFAGHRVAPSVATAPARPRTR